MSALGDVLAAVARVLDERKIGWYVFGAQAVAIRGAPRATLDVDITVSVAPSELPGLIEALEPEGITPRYGGQTEALLRAASVVPLVHESGMEVDLVVGASGLEQLALARAERIEVEGTAVPIAHPTDLVVMKVLAGRGKDLDDVRALLASGEVDVGVVRDLLGQLEAALDQSDLLPRFEAALSDV